MSAGKPPPTPDRDSEPFWQGLREGELRLQRCSGCGALRWPPRAVCNRCRGFDASWQPVGGRGRIVAWTRTHQVFSPAYADEVPYVVVQVALEEQDDLLLIGGWSGEADPRGGQPVRARIVPAQAGFHLLSWEPA